MYKELRKEAEEKVEAKLGFYVTVVVFSFVSIVLLMISFYLPEVAFWLRLPIPIFLMVICIVYMVTFGFPGTDPDADDWKEDEIEKEMIKLYRKRKARFASDEKLTDSDILELKELERLENKWDWEEDEV